VDEYSYSNSNLEMSVKHKSKKIIGTILKKINLNNKTNYKFLEIDRINQKINIIDEELITVAFTISEVNKYTSYRVLLQFLIQKNAVILRFIESLQNNINYNNIATLNNNEVKTFNIIPQEKPANYTNEPCKFNLHEWDRNGINYQLKLKPYCNIDNNTDNTATYSLYDNPTLFTN
tara:strand:+ start:1257 stop:1784 length:528 start_codon:yes stop_codon:yes gene_type:complete